MSGDEYEDYLSPKLVLHQIKLKTPINISKRDDLDHALTRALFPLPKPGVMTNEGFRVDPWHRDMFSVAMGCMNTQMITMLIKRQPHKVNGTNPVGTTHVGFAIRVAKLVKHPSNAVDCFNVTSLLLRAGADPSRRSGDQFGRTAYEEADGDQRLVDLVVQHIAR